MLSMDEMENLIQRIRSLQQTPLHGVYVLCVHHPESQEDPLAQQTDDDDMMLVCVRGLNSHEAWRFYERDFPQSTVQCVVELEQLFEAKRHMQEVFDGSIIVDTKNLL